MKERPILFNAPMINAILAGEKTQTRRIVKHIPDWCTRAGYTCFTPKGCVSFRGVFKEYGPAEKFIKCRYGEIGDELWVRETFRKQRGQILYRADYEKTKNFKWKPSVHMSRQDSRIQLKIINIRVERLQDISDEDCYAEGIEEWLKNEENHPICNGKKTKFTNVKQAFKHLWESINGEGSWKTNPWLWVIEFERIVK